MGQWGAWEHPWMGGVWGFELMQVPFPGCFPPQKPHPWTAWARGCLWMGDLGVSPVLSSITWPCSLLHIPISGYVLGSNPSLSQGQMPAIGLQQMMVELKSAGHAPACPAPWLCH